MLAVIALRGDHGSARRGAPKLIALVSREGRVTVRDGETTIGTIAAGMHLEGWRGADLAPVGRSADVDARPGPRSGKLAAAAGDVAVETSVGPDGSGLQLMVRMTPSAELIVNSVRVSIDLPAGSWVPARWSAGSQ